MAGSSLAEIITAWAAFIAAGTAAIGVNTWRAELKGKAEFEIARNLMRSVYKARESIAHIRSPFIMAMEFPEEYRSAQPRPTREQAQSGYAFVYQKRWDRLTPTIEELGVLSLEAEVLLGKEVSDAVAQFRRCIVRLNVSLQDFIEEKGEPTRSPDREYSKKIRADVCDAKEDDNELTQEINRTISALESLMVKHLKG